MHITDIIGFAIFLISGIIASYTDIKYGKVKNVLSFVVLFSGLLLRFFDIFIFKLEYPIKYILNISTCLAIVILLYILKFWAGGDSKYTAAILFILPAKIIFSISPVIALAFAFTLSYIFLIFDSLAYAIKDHKIVSPTKIRQSVKFFLVSYTLCLSLLILLNRIINNAYVSANHNIFIDILLSFSCTILIGCIKEKFKIVLLVITASTNIIIDIITNSSSFNIHFFINSGIALFALIAKTFIDEYNYKTIRADTVKKGDILSAETSIKLRYLKKHEVPNVSKERMSDRLSEDEANSIRLWGEKNNCKICIVRKIPFIVFIFLGTLFYIILGEFSL